MSGKRRLEKSSHSLKKLITQYFMQMHGEAAAGKFVTWIAIIVPIEILKGFDIVIAVPENHSAMCAARGAGATQAAKAELEGYTMDLCSYARIDLGTWFAKGEGSPSMGMPGPDLLISNNNNCSLLVKWFDIYRRELQVPHFVLDVPFCYAPQQKKDLEYIIAQFRDLIAMIENLTGQSWDESKVREAVRLTDEANGHWRRFLNLAERHPAGMTAFDSFVHMAPYITSYRGTQELVDHCKLLADETEALADSGDVPVPKEKHRLLWDNIAPWHQLRKMSGKLAELEANVTCASYTSCMGTLEGQDEQFRFGSEDPLQDLARIQNFSVCPHGLELRYEAMCGMIERMDINGVIFSSNSSCKVYSVMQMDLMRKIERRYKIPTVMIDLDHADPRQYNEEKEFLKVEAMLERRGA